MTSSEQLEINMLILKQHSQHLYKADTAQHNAVFNEKQRLRFLKLSEKINARLLCIKTESDHEMIEKFYSRLLPVTYRDWVCNKTVSLN